ncbi:MAG: pyruvate kinase, partial [Burkholderiales bacterium]|nr:pyruvate kinase [Burkholderiales bacterium]
MSHRRRTRILCTIGPASASEEVMEGLFDAGMDVARLNFSHGTHQDHRVIFDRLRRLSKARSQFLAILQDLSGPKIRLGSVAPGTVLTEGSRFILTSDPIEGNEEGAQVTYQQLADEVAPGHGVLLDDGLLALEVER